VKISMISESEFTVKGHGVHTAFVELTNALRRYTDVEVQVNHEAKRTVDITHIHTIGTFALRRLLFDRSKKVVSAHIVPASLVGSLVGARLWLPFARWYLRWFYNRADLVLAVSDETRRELQAIGVKKPIEVVYNLVDTTKYKTTAVDKRQARERLGIKPDAWVVVGAGQVQPRKRIDSFIEAAKKLPGMQFVWVGGMPFGKLAAESAAMQRLIDTAPANVTFTGIVELEDVCQHYQAADVFWLPSDQETFGLVIVEAAAVGLPVVLRDIPDYAETFADNAILVKEPDTANMLELLRTDKTFYKKAAAQSARIATRYDAKAGAQRITQIYQGLLKTNK